MESDVEWVCAICLDGVNDDPCQVHACKRHKYHSLCLAKANKADDRCSLCRETGKPAATVKSSVAIMRQSYTYHIRSVPQLYTDYTQGYARTISLSRTSIVGIHSVFDNEGHSTDMVFYQSDNNSRSWPPF